MMECDLGRHRSGRDVLMFPMIPTSGFRLCTYLFAEGIQTNNLLTLQICCFGIFLGSKIQTL